MLGSLRQQAVRDQDSNPGSWHRKQQGPGQAKVSPVVGSCTCIVLQAAAAPALLFLLMAEFHLWAGAYALIVNGTSVVWNLAVGNQPGRSVFSRNPTEPSSLVSWGKFELAF